MAVVLVKRLTSVGVCLTILWLSVAAVMSPSGDLLATAEGQSYLRLLGDSLSSGTAIATEDDFLGRARQVAREFFGQTNASYRRLSDNLAAWYAQVRGADVVVVYNPGGLGKTTLEDDPQWASVVAGLRSTLEELGYRVRLLQYRRTSGGLASLLAEFRGLFGSYRSKAESLAARIDFFSRLDPDQKVIITGMSAGAAYSDAVVSQLQSNPAVYAVEAGRPFWYQGADLDRTLVLTSNGRESDALAEGRWLDVALTTLSQWLSSANPMDGLTGFSGSVHAPGHRYYWEDPGVGSPVRAFLLEQFGR